MGRTDSLLSPDVVSAGRRALINGFVFDKDGTLLDFHATWDGAFGAMLADFAAGSAGLCAELDRVLGFDRTAGTILPDSPFVAGSSAGCGNSLAAVIGRPRDDTDLLVEIEEAIARHMPAMPTAAPGADDVLRALAAQGLPMAIATNDCEARARDQVESLGWGGHFVTVLGYDSGHGEKPDPGMVVAAAEAMRLDPSEVAMVGDSSTDMGAGNAAGATTILMGPRRDLRDQADHVLGELAELVHVRSTTD